MVEIKVSNLIATIKINRPIDFDWLSSQLPGKRGGKRFPGYIVRLLQATLLMFRNGKIVVVGAKSFQQLEEIRRWVKEFFGLKHLPRVYLSNIVASVDFKRKIDLERIVDVLAPYIHYEPEVFPGATIYHDGYPGVAILLFSTGKAIITGSASLEDVNNLAEWLSRLVEKYSCL